MGRKHCGKIRKCWLPAFSPFPTMFSKGSSLGVVKSRDCIVKNLQTTISNMMKMEENASNGLGNTVGKGEIVRYGPANT